MRKTIKSLEADLEKAKDDAHKYENILSRIHQIVFPKSSTYAEPYSNLPAEFLKLKTHVDLVQGMYRPETETIHILKEIIRWKINPETALESKVQDVMEKFKGRGMF